MTTVSDIYKYIDELAPFRIQDKWDNAGLLVGSMESKVDRVLLALDATVKVCAEAKALGCGLVVTHHPVIFDPLRRLSDNDPACILLKSGIACICAHTNLDSAEYSISDIMCDRLGMKNTHELMEANRRDPVKGRDVGYGAIGECSEMTPWELAKLCENVFGCIAIKYSAGTRNIRRVGMISGAGSDGIEKAIEKKLDALVTSEVKHHQFLEAERIGITLIDAGHHETEAIAMPYLQEKLSERFASVEFRLTGSAFCGMTI